MISPLNVCSRRSLAGRSFVLQEIDAETTPSVRESSALPLHPYGPCPPANHWPSVRRKLLVSPRSGCGATADPRRPAFRSREHVVGGSSRPRRAWRSCRCRRSGPVGNQHGARADRSRHRRHPWRGRPADSVRR